jgi:hypothetical protein
MAIKPNIVMARVKKLSEQQNAENAQRHVRSQQAKIINEETYDGFTTRTQGNESIAVEAFTPNYNGRNRKMSSSLTVTLPEGKVTLSGRNARTLYRVLANHYGANVE